MIEVIPDREVVKLRMQELVRSGNAPGMRPPIHPELHYFDQRVVARSQLLFSAARRTAVSSPVPISYSDAIRCAEQGSLAKPPTRRSIRRG